MRTIILLGLLLLVSCGGGSVTPNPNPPNDSRILVTTMGVMDGGLGSTIRATITTRNELKIVCDARSGKTLHFWATIMLYDADGSRAAIIPLDFTGNYSETYTDIPASTAGVWINDWGMRE